MMMAASNARKRLPSELLDAAACGFSPVSAPFVHAASAAAIASTTFPLRSHSLRLP